MTNAKAIRTLQSLKCNILADEKVNWEETERLRNFLSPLLSKFGADFGRYLDLLDRCREDGKITKEESELLAASLDLLCAKFTIRQLRFWLIVAVVAFFVALFI